ncbi:PAS domain-containing sensor histidine kinase [Novilysobacter arseniciresistens]|uniref:PAS domain-containing sensor histidine kinase n=1 Tax=Novilysobacter arseniciresistens TaxID=1385522 RepID=UPI0009DF2680|nr:PAS domain-containing protein [Lysobacter arseniciresistens]
MPLPNCEQLFQSSPNAYMVLDRQLRFIEANQAYAQLTGRSRDELIGRCLFDVFPGTRNPDGSSQVEQLRASIERAFATGERDVLALIPYRVGDGDAPSGEVRYWSATHTPLRDANGAVSAVMQHTTDVTAIQRLREEVRQARAAAGPTMEQLSEGVFERAASVQRDNLRLAAREGFMTDLFEQAPGFIAVLRGPDHVFELANDAYEQLVGRRDLIGRGVREALPELSGQGFFELLDQVRSTGRPFVGRSVPVELNDIDGLPRTVFVDFVYQPVRGASGAVESIFVQGSDVTDRETALDALRQSESRFHTIADLLPQMVWSTRPDGEVEYFNRRWYEFTGDGRGAIGGHAWVGRVHEQDRDRALAAWQASVATGDPYEVEYRLRDRHGEHHWVLARGLPVPGADGALLRWIGTCTLIHEQKRVQQMLEESQQALRSADDQRNRFLATLAHELRNPLAPIANAAQLLKMAPDRQDTVSHTAGVIERQAEHMRRLVEDLLDVSRVTRGQARLHLAPVVLVEAVAVAVEQTAGAVAESRNRLEVIDRAPGLRVRGDALRVTQIVANLVSNAAKFTPAGGRIVVEIDREGDGDDAQACIRVTDTGIGLPPELLEQVFELFVQADGSAARSGGGLGIGLSLARSLAQLHGGSLAAHSDGPGQGSSFVLRLPVER